jgi:hypothetical protein
MIFLAGVGLDYRPEINFFQFLTLFFALNGVANLAIGIYKMVNVIFFKPSIFFGNGVALHGQVNEHEHSILLKKLLFRHLYNNFRNKYTNVLSVTFKGKKYHL